MKKLVFYISLFVSFLFSYYSFAQNNLEAQIDSLVPSMVNDTTPGLVVGIVQNGELVFSKGYGLANLAYSIPNDSKMVYNVGSVSKQFLGYAFAMLQLKGEINIDDPVSKHLEDWPVFEHPVTLLHLLSHTSGYREAYTMSSLAGRIIGVDHLSREECLNVVRRQPKLEFVPGSRFTYNSTAWVILAEVLENVTGTPADLWVEKNILNPLEMNNTQIETHVGEVINNAAESYSHNEDNGYTNHESNRAIFGAAEIYTSIEDLVKWIKNYKTGELGGQAALDLFLKPFILNDGSNSEYALGISNGNYKGLKRYRHTGGHEAFSSQLSYFPDHDLGIITISNYGGKGWLSTSKIADLILKDHIIISEPVASKTYEAATEELNKYAGLYVPTSLNETFNLSVLNDTLTTENGTKLIPTAKNTFKIEGWNGKIKFEENTEGEMELLIEDGSTSRSSKVEPYVNSEEALASYEGDYWSDELETIYHLHVKDQKLSVKHRWIGEVTLEPFSQDFFRTDKGFYVKFIRNSNNELEGMSVNTGRTFDVYFQRHK